MPVRLYVYRFLRKFVFDVLPAALASLVGALFFAHQWTQTPPRGDAARLNAQNEQIVTMIRDEQTLMRALLQREQKVAVQRQAASAKTADKEPARDVKERDKTDKDKDKVEKTKADKPRTDTAKADVAKADVAKVETTGSTGSMRRRSEPPREASRAVVAAAPSLAVVAPLPPVPPAVIPAVEPPPVVALESGPLVAPPQPEGIITRIVSAGVAMTNRVVESSGLPVIQDLAPVTPAMAAKSEAGPVGHVLDAKP
jgi:hypothetical protein